MSEHYDVKQVILMRTDLRNTEGHKVRSGKLMAQAGHASMLWLADAFRNHRRPEITEEQETWLTGSSTKVVLAVDNLEELEYLVEEALVAGVPVFAVTDLGRTEFGGEPTVTCAAIGPAASDKIDPITRHLKPY